MCRQRVVKPAPECNERSSTARWIYVGFDRETRFRRRDAIDAPCGSLEIERGSSPRETERISLLPAAVRREREFLRPIAPIVTGAGESPSTFKFDIAHHVPGRMRIRSAALKGNVCASEDARRPREPVYIAEGEFARGSTGGRKNLAGYRWFESISLQPSSSESSANPTQSVRRRHD
jgi:hypothetical protein